MANSGATGGGKSGPRRVHSWDPLPEAQPADLSPGTVTALATYRGSAHWRRLELDGERWLLVSDRLLLDFGLYKGAAVDLRGMGEIWSRTAAERAEQDGLRLLALQSRTRRGLEILLLRRGHQPAAAGAAVQSLAARGMLDDWTFAETFVRSRLAAGGWGEQRLRAELRRRGVPGNITDAVIGEQVDADEMLATAIALARARVQRLSHLEPLRAASRVAAFLARRGFRETVIRQALRRALAED